MANSSLVDVLAEQLGEKIGAKIKVIRILDPNEDSIGRVRVGRYQLLIIRGEHDFISGYMRVDEAKRFLALISDWVNFGFVRLEDPARREELTSPPHDGMMQGQGDIK